MDDGYLSLDCTHKFIPHGVHLSAGQLRILTAVPGFLSVAALTSKLVSLLSISEDFVTPNDLINALVKRYCIMMNLPGRQVSLCRMMKPVLS